MEFSIKKFTIDKYNCKKKKEEIINNDQSIKLVKSINYDNNNRALSWNEVYRIYQDKSYIKTIFKNSITSSAITQQSSTVRRIEFGKLTPFDFSKISRIRQTLYLIYPVHKFFFLEIHF